MKKNNLTKNFLIFILVFIFIASFFSLYNTSQVELEKISLNQLVDYLNEEKINTINIDGEKLNIILKDGSEKVSQKEIGESLTTTLRNYGLETSKLQNITLNIETDTEHNIWLTTVIPILLPILFIGVFIFFMFRQVQGSNNRAMSFGQSGAKINPLGKSKVTFADVAGSTEAKQELSEVVDFLKYPSKYINLGAKIPKGILLLGSPGTGKTLLARAVAGEAKVPFFHISGSEFVEMFVGVGASRVRDLFKKAKKMSPCIIFIDEIDAVGRRRGAGLGGSHDEREQTLNQILVEMDGFEQSTNVIVLAATNRPDVLDPALLRPGRFDRQVIIDLPDINDRQAILDIHAKTKPFTENVDLKTIAQRTPGLSGADLANILNEAAILTARNNRKQIIMEDVLEALEKVTIGPERKSHILSDKEKKITAYHEAGHALLAHLIPEADPVHKVSIISRGRAAGYTMKLPLEDKHLHSYSDFLAELAVLLGGHTAEKKVFGEVTTGASNDLQRATKLAENLIMQYGMSEKMGPRTFGEHEEMIFLGNEIHKQRDYSEATAEKIDQEVSSMISTAAKTALDLITKHRDSLDKIANQLLEKETIEKDDFSALFTS
ncbi:MAG: cell division protein FtsH [Candidatus Komeilibacteria bacterium CG_4_9_14_0_8_um_filter_36_9]|uniref:ATP-dependent zinc metalloprotease FtsH n=2 Tax=Candidatus Komeiliibacteriota TaxID=1817908 RepID=A0A2M8DS55_9BACT|nr:MAG: cell division protein FtsH [Candidatus Komeilibacteria bacterium CG_4_10_14_0_8_um_filter_37_78]PJC02200.1 MAG: cell division protein FtsH [Candidatus Komeilibacteria bacterium CG_4_9_14_0_8_um_filter_36_9]